MNRFGFAATALAAVAGIALISPATIADEEKKPEPPQFELPKDADIDALFAFMNRVKQTPPTERTKEAVYAHAAKQIKAVLAACDVIMKQKPNDEQETRVVMERFAAYQTLEIVEPGAGAKGQTALMKQYAEDKRAEIQKVIGLLKFQARASGLQQMKADAQTALANDFATYLSKHGIGQQSMQLAQGLAQGLEFMGNSKAGALIYKAVIGELKKLKAPGADAEVERLMATVRRLELPGNVMKVEGTTADGKAFDWKAYRGKVVLVDFWASWCGPCRAELPNMKEQLAKYGDKGFAIVGINLDDDMEAYQKIVESEELSWVNLVGTNEETRGWNHPLVKYYGIQGIPTAILVGKDGKVVSLSARGEELNRLLAELLDK